MSDTNHSRRNSFFAWLNITTPKNRVKDHSSMHKLLTNIASVIFIHDSSPIVNLLLPRKTRPGGHTTIGGMGNLHLDIRLHQTFPPGRDWDIHSTVQVVATIAGATTGGDGGMRRQLGHLQHVHRLLLLLDGEVKGVYSLQVWSEIKSEIFTLIIYEVEHEFSIRQDYWSLYSSSSSNSSSSSIVAS